MGGYATATNEARSYAHFISAVMYGQQGRNDLEVEALNRVAKLAPDSPTPTVYLMRAFLRKGDFDQALKASEQSVKQAPDRPELWLLLGQMRHQRHDFEGAAAAYNKAIALQPDDLVGYGALVELQESANDLVAAQEIYENLVARNPNSGALHYQLGLNLMRMKDYTGAIAAFRKVMALEPRVARAQYMLGLALMEADQNEEAAAELSKYIQDRPDETAALEFLAAAYARLGKYEKAADACGKLLESKATQPKHFLQAAWVMLQAGRNKEAARLAPESGSPVLAGVFAVLANRAMGADSVDEYAGLDGIEGDVEAECDGALTELLTLFGVPTTGDHLLEMLRALPQGIDQSRVLSFVASRVLIQMERYAEAAPLLEKAMDKFGPSKGLHYELAVCYEKLDNPVKVEQHLQACLVFDPGNPELLNFLGYYYADKNVKLKEAEALLKKALNAEPNNPFYLDSLGWVYYRMGKAKEALDLVRRAIYGMGSDDAELRNHLGDIYLLNGDDSAAVDQWRRALRLDPKMDEVKKKIEAHAPKK
jgi:tetratricopeptide (TPR) repeat protein